MANIINGKEKYESPYMQKSSYEYSNEISSGKNICDTNFPSDEQTPGKQNGSLQASKNDFNENQDPKLETEISSRNPSLEIKEASCRANEKETHESSSAFMEDNDFCRERQLKSLFRRFSKLRANSVDYGQMKTENSEFCLADSAKNTSDEDLGEEISASHSVSETSKETQDTVFSSYMTFPSSSKLQQLREHKLPSAAVNLHIEEIFESLRKAEIDFYQDEKVEDTPENFNSFRKFLKRRLAISDVGEQSREDFLLLMDFYLTKKKELKVN